MQLSPSFTDSSDYPKATPTIFDLQGNPISSEEIREKAEHYNQNPSIIFGTDQDDTMVGNDIGKMVFRELVINPKLMKATPEEFSKLLIPKLYLTVIKQNLDSSKAKTHCQRAIELNQRLPQLYKEIKLSHGSTPELDREFAEKMMEFDNLIMQLESAFRGEIQTKLLLMRTRFFMGMTDTEAEKLTIKAINRQENEEDFFKALKLNSGIFELTTVFKDQIIAVITTNTAFKSKPFLQHGPYQHIINIEYLRSSLISRIGNIFGTKLTKQVFQAQKIEEIKALEQQYQASIVLTAGDSPSNDGPMLIHTLENKGQITIAGPTFDDAMRRFTDAQFFKKLPYHEMKENIFVSPVTVD